MEVQFLDFDLTLFHPFCDECDEQEDKTTVGPLAIRTFCPLFLDAQSTLRQHGYCLDA